MIKLIREGSKKYPWLLKIIMILIAVTFTIGMGWFGYESTQQPNAVAMVGDYSVGLEEFRRAYNRTYQFYRNELKQEVVDEADLKQKVIQSMVDQKVWLLTADDWDVGVPPEALRVDIMKRKEFQRTGRLTLISIIVSSLPIDTPLSNSRINLPETSAGNMSNSLPRTLRLSILRKSRKLKS